MSERAPVKPDHGPTGHRSLDDIDKTTGQYGTDQAAVDQSQAFGMDTAAARIGGQGTEAGVPASFDQWGINLHDGVWSDLETVVAGGGAVLLAVMAFYTFVSKGRVKVSHDA